MSHRLTNPPSTPRQSSTSKRNSKQKRGKKPLPETAISPITASGHNSSFPSKSGRESDFEEGEIIESHTSRSSSCHKKVEISKQPTSESNGSTIGPPLPACSTLVSPHSNLQIPADNHDNISPQLLMDDTPPGVKPSAISGNANSESNQARIIDGKSVEPIHDPTDPVAEAS
eukprot:502061_1